MTVNTQDLQKEVWKSLDNVMDPEMEPVSIVELGMVEDVEVEGKNVNVTLLPTFSGCPALDMIKENVIDEVEQAIQKLDESLKVQVKFRYDPSWTTDRINESGREKLKTIGIAVPDPDQKRGDSWEVRCPYCDSVTVTMENIFGPTACRSILYCKSCRNPFEAMKPIA